MLQEIRSPEQLIQLANRFERILVIGFYPWNGWNHFLYTQLECSSHIFQRDSIGLAFFCPSGAKDDELRFCPELAPFLHRFRWIFDPLFFVWANGAIQKVRGGNPSASGLAEWVTTDYLTKMFEELALEGPRTPSCVFERFLSRLRDGLSSAEKLLTVLEKYAESLDFHVMIFLEDFVHHFIQLKRNGGKEHELLPPHLWNLFFNLDNQKPK